MGFSDQKVVTQMDERGARSCCEKHQKPGLRVFHCFVESLGKIIRQDKNSDRSNSLFYLEQFVFHTGLIHLDALPGGNVLFLS